MFPILAAIPTIMSAISGVTDLFNAGKKAKEKVTGAPSVASTPEELDQEINSLPPDTKAQWAEIMKQKVDLYQAENQRLALEIGTIDTNITSKVDTNTASKISEMRMTTRPWAVRMMIHFILFPFYLVIIDVAQELVKVWLISPFGWKITVFKSFEYVFGVYDPTTFEKIAELLKSPQSHTLMGSMYQASVPWAASIVLGYMGLREIGKAKGTSGDTPLGSVPVGGMGTGAGAVVTKTIGKGLDLVNKIKSIFKK